MAISVLGLDIGGANLKAAHSCGVARFKPFAIWKNPNGLAAALAQLLAALPARDQLAITMTGELCDCFETKRQGVFAILDAVQAVAGTLPIQVWQTDGRFVDPAAARVSPNLVAAANWHALATYAGRLAPSGSALLIDVGSTTTDIIPLVNGKLCPRGRTDPERLRNSELVYTGVRRTPVCALLGSEVAAEHFATTLDAYLMLGAVPEDETDCDTADGRPALRTAAHARLARMLCADQDSCRDEDTRRLAETIRARQVSLVREAIHRVAAFLPSPPSTVVQSGSGEFLIREVLEAPPPLALERLSLAEKLGPELSRCACAYALAVQAVEQAESDAGNTFAPIVVKVGGSLFDLPDLGARLTLWLKSLPPGAILLVPGGGAAADVVRELDKRHGLGEKKAHWLALHSLSLNARFLADLLPGAELVRDAADCADCWRACKIPVLDPYRFALADERQIGALPHSWSVTSDSLAARVARVMGAHELILLKSVTVPETVDWDEAGQVGLVDAFFAKAAKGLRVQAVNIRDLHL